MRKLYSKRRQWMIAVLVTTRLLTSFSAIADTQPTASTQDSANDPCSSGPCRDPATIDLFPGTSSELRFNVPRGPYTTSEGHIVIMPGERLVFRFEPQGDVLGMPKFVRAERLADEPVPDMSGPAFDKLDKTDANDVGIAQQMANLKTNGTAKDQLKNEPAGTLILTYGPISGATGMTLTIEHNLPQTLKLAAFAMTPVSGNFQLNYTSTCSVLPLLLDVETWRQPLGGIILEKFEYQSGDQKSVVCS